MLWMVHVEAGPLRVPPAFGQCQRGAGEPRWRGKLWVSPVLDHQPFAWFAWVQRARVTRWWLFGFVGCVGQRLGTRRRRLWDCLVQPVPLGEAVDFTGRFPPAPACFSCVARQPQVPIPFPTVCCPMQECCLPRGLSSPWCGVCLLSFVFSV